MNDVITNCDLCDADITDIDLLDGAELGGWDHPDFGAMPSQCVACVEISATPPWLR